MAAPPVLHCTIQGVTINSNGASSSAVLRRADLINCTIKGIQIHNCTISDCQVDNCELFNCTVKNSTIIKSNLHMSSHITNCSLDDCTMTKSPLAFRRFPRDIRAMIFQYCLSWFSDQGKSVQKTPKLLVALRCDSQLYFEAIKLFYKQNVFRVNKENFQDCNSMSKQALESIFNLKIISHSCENRLEAGKLSEALEHCKAVAALEISTFNALELRQWVQACLTKFTAIRRLIIWIPSCHINPGNSPGADGLINILPELGQRLGGPGSLWSVRTDKWEGWFWEAPKGQTLKWMEG